MGVVARGAVAHVEPVGAMLAPLVGDHVGGIGAAADGRHLHRTDATHRFGSRRTVGRPGSMGIGTSIFLIAVGAILKFAVTATVSGVELATVGVILMVVGILGLVISLV